MAISPISVEAKSRRPPGVLPNTFKHAEEAFTALDRAPAGIKEALKPAFEAIVEGARVQQRLNAMLWSHFSGLPGKHSSTHRDGNDSVASDADPTAIAITNVAAPGTPHHGLSRDDHVHPVSDAIIGVIDIFDGIDVDPMFGLPVTDTLLRRLLERILLEVMALAEHLKAIFPDAPEEEVMQTIALPVVVIPSTTSSVTLMGSNSERTGFVIVNDGTQTLYVKYGPGASTTDWTYKVVSGVALEPTYTGYTGVVTGVWDVANGNGRVTEIQRVRA